MIEIEVLAAMKSLAVMKENKMVAIDALMRMVQERDEPIRAFGARVRGQASVCKFHKPCPCGLLQSEAHTDNNRNRHLRHRSRLSPPARHTKTEPRAHAPTVAAPTAEGTGRSHALHTAQRATTAPAYTTMLRFAGARVKTNHQRSQRWRERSATQFARSNPHCPAKSTRSTITSTTKRRGHGLENPRSHNPTSL